jgi:lysophospholipase L1-like esterase
MKWIETGQVTPMVRQSGEETMSEARVAWGWRKIARLGGLASGLAVALLIAFFALERVSEVVFFRVALGFLIALEALYGVALVFGLVGASVLTIVVSRARTRGMRCPTAARGLLLCTSLLVGLSLCEMTAAALRAVSRRTSAVPAGGLAESERTDQTDAPPVPLKEIVLPTTFPEASGEDDVSLVVLGESSAEGIPYNMCFSIGELIVWKLREAIPGRRFHLRVLASSGDTLEGQHKQLADLTRRPDVLLIYCGHNEFSARFSFFRDWDYYHDAHAPTPWELFVTRAERLSPLCGLIRATADKCRIAIPPPRFGNRALVDIPVYTTKEYKTLLADFQRRLEIIVSYAERLGALPILLIPPANDSGFEPNRSVLPPETTRAERAAFTREFSEARRLESSEPLESQRRYRSLLERQPGFAEVHFRLARLLERAGAWDVAYRHDIAARDGDGLPMRCLTAFQEVYRSVASRHRCVLIDGQAEFHAIGEHGLLEDHLFHDGMHPSMRGMLALAEAVLREPRVLRAFGWPRALPPPIIDPARCAKRFGLGPEQWNKICLWGIMFYDLTAPARYDPTYRRARQRAFAKAADRIAGGEPAEAVGLPNIGIPEPVSPRPLAAPPTSQTTSPGVGSASM